MTTEKKIKDRKQLIQKIKNKLLPSEIVSHYNLKMGTNNNSCHCPFHEDNKPSFSFDDKKGLLTCFSKCKLSLDVIGFVQKIDNLSFDESLIKCAAISGIIINCPEENKSNKILNEDNKSNLENSNFAIQKILTNKALNDSEKPGNQNSGINDKDFFGNLTKNTKIQNDKNYVEEKESNKILNEDNKSNLENSNFAVQKILTNKALNELQNVHFQYLLKRGITESTAKTFNLKSRGDYILFPQQRNGHVTGHKGININNKKMFFEGSDNKSKLWPDYHLEGIKTIIFTAGEYDTLLMNQKLLEENLLTYKAITNSTGEGNIPQDINRLKDYPEIEKFIIAYDNDEAGKKGSETIAKALQEINKPIEIKQFPEDKAKGYDISDFFNEGHSIHDFFKLKSYIFKPEEKPKSLYNFKFITPDDYNITDNGINKITFNSKDEPKIEYITTDPVLITKKAINTDEKIIKVELAFKVSGIWEKLQVEREIICDSRKIITLGNYGFPVHSGNAKKVIEYLNAFEKANEDFLETVYLTHNNGWKEHNNKKIFGLGTNIVGLDSTAKIAFSPEPGFERFTKALNTHGTYEKWKESIKLIMNHDKVVFALYASLAAPLLSLVDAPSFLIHYWGDSSMGKTTALEVAASIWGNPAKEAGGLVTSWNNTQVFVERIATFFDDLPLFLDDSQTADDKIISNIVYMVANSTGKGRGSKVSGVRHTSSWQTICFSTGEKQLTESTQYDGARARTIELAGSPFGRNEGKLVNNVKSGVRENYGFAGNLFILHLLDLLSDKEKVQELKEAYRFYRDELSKKAKNEIGDRLAHYFAVIQLAGFLANEHLKLGGDHNKVIETMFLETITERHQEGDISTRALQEVISFAQGNMKSFMGKADESTREHFGIWKDAEYIAFYPHKLKEFLGKNGFSNNSILKSWSDRGWIKKETDRFSYPIFYENQRHRMIVIRWEAVKTII